MKPFEIKQSDTDPPLRAILKDANGRLAQLSPGDVVTFRMTPRVKGLRLDISAPAVVNDLARADVEFRWASVMGSTDTPGVYDAEFHVAYAAGGSKTFPNGDEFILVQITHKAAA